MEYRFFHSVMGWNNCKFYKDLRPALSSKHCYGFHLRLPARLKSLPDYLNKANIRHKLLPRVLNVIWGIYYDMLSHINLNWTGKYSEGTEISERSFHNNFNIPWFRFFWYYFGVTNRDKTKDSWLTRLFKGTHWTIL